MTMKGRSCCTLLSTVIISISVIGFSNTEDNNRLLNVLKKNANTSGNYSNNKEDVFKAEAMKMIKKCQTDNTGNSEIRKQNESGTYNNGYSRNYNGYNSYNNENNMRDTDYRSNGYGNDYSNRNNKNSFEYGSNGNSPRSSKNCTENKRSGFAGDDTNDDYGRSQGTYYNSNRGEGNNGNFGLFDRNYFSARVRREDRRNNDNQCVSQCVFGYMDLVDEDQNPSETLTIKWLQDHMTNNDLKHIKAIRDVRRCFAKLSTSEIEDGCEFSKELSNCMNLDLE